MTAEQLVWLAGPGSVEVLIRRSRFLGLALPCESESVAQQQLAEIRAEHPKATHHVHAWRLRAAGTGRITHRFDDDGEPGGTAGRPVLAALEGRQVVNAQVIVVRYFGGIKLGAGGLARAYGEAAGKALAAGELRPLIPTRVVTVRLPFAHVPWLERVAAREGLGILSRAFAADATIALAVPDARVASLSREILDLTAGTASIEAGPETD
jgi:uncharacterized YigZ family protein